MKRWVKVSRSANGPTVVTVSLVDGALSAKYAIKVGSGQIRWAVKEADKHARSYIEELRAVTEELGD